ncbi:MAG: YkoF family thiamine/hydroxymethylpyrimidine-binding protein [Planctomycetota bacterium]|nr:YkoF family thiamine/hydroxymethylpyrimidine-binding protein [Planctomycetota bacterium]
MNVQAQLSVYALDGTTTKAVKTVLKVLREHGLNVHMGNMSSVVSGPADMVFDGIKKASEAAMAHSPCVVNVTFSNACPAE